MENKIYLRESYFSEKETELLSAVSIGRDSFHRRLSESDFCHIKTDFLIVGDCGCDFDNLFSEERKSRLNPEIIGTARDGMDKIADQPEIEVDRLSLLEGRTVFISIIEFFRDLGSFGLVSDFEKFFRFAVFENPIKADMKIL